MMQPQRVSTIAAYEQGFVQYGKSGNKSSASAHSQIEKRR